MLNVGHRIIEYIIQEGNLQPFLDAGFTPEWLIDDKDMTRVVVFPDVDREAYSYILNHWARHGQVPLPEIFEKSFPPVSYGREESDWTPDELIDQAYTLIKTDLVQATIADLNELQEKEEFDKALLQIQEAAERFNIPATDLGFELAVQAQVRKLRVSEEARERVNGFSDWAAPQFLDPAQIQAQAEKMDWRVAHMISLGSNIVINATRKAGKSTLMINLIRSLTTGAPFLDAYRVEPVKNVKVFDLEMPLATSKQWLADAGIVDGDNVGYAFLTGQVSRLDILNDKHRAQIAESLRGTDVLIIDPLGPLIAAMGLEENSNTEIRRLLNALADMKHQAGISELVVVVHAGHNAQSRARGASVLADWPDAVITLKNDKPDDTYHPRKISAFGRDVYVEPTMLHYDHGTRTLRTDEGNYMAAQGDSTTVVLEALMTGRKTVRQLRELTSYGSDKLYKLLDGLVSQGKVRVITVDSRKFWEAA